MNENRDYYEIDLKRLLLVLWQKAWVIVLAAVVGAASVYAGTVALVTPQYQSSVMVYVNNSSISINSSFSISASELSAAQSLVDTYLVILTSRTTLDDVAEKANVDYTYGELKNMISAGAVNDTEIFEVKVTSPNPEEAKRIANTIAVVLPDKISAIVEGSSVRVVDYAVEGTSPVSPNYTMNALLGMVIGFVLSVLAVLLYDMLNDSIRSEDYLIQAYPDIPLLVVVPDAVSKKGHKYYAGSKHYGSGYYGYGKRTGRSREEEK